MREKRPLLFLSLFPPLCPELSMNGCPKVPKGGVVCVCLLLACVTVWKFLVGPLLFSGQFIAAFSSGQCVRDE